MTAPANATSSPYSYEEMKARQQALGPTGPGGPINDAVLNEPAMDPEEPAAEPLNPKPTVPEEKPHSYGERVQMEEMKHIADGIRKDYPGQIPADADPRDVISVHRAMHAPDEEPTLYLDALRAAYAKDFKKPLPNLGEAAGMAGEFVKAIPGAIVSGLTAPVEAIQQVHGAEKTAEKRGALASQAVQALHGKELLASHAATGTPMETQGALSQQEEAQRHEANLKAAEGGAMYATLPFGGLGASALKGAAVPIAARIGVGAAEGAAIAGGYAGTEQGLQAKFEGKGAGEIYNAIVSAGTNPQTLALGATVGGVIPAVHMTGESILGKVTGSIGRKANATEILQRASMKNEMMSRFVDEVTPAQIKMRYSADLDQAAAQGATPEVTARVILSKLTGDAPEQMNAIQVAQMAAKIRAQQTADAAVASGLAAKRAAEASELASRQDAVAGAIPDVNLPAPEPNAPLPGITNSVMPETPQGAIEPRPVDLPAEPTAPLGIERPEPTSPTGPPTPRTEGGEINLPRETGYGQMLPERQPVATPEVPGPTPMGAGPVAGQAPEPHAPPALQGPVSEQFPKFEPPTGVRRPTSLEKTPAVSTEVVGQAGSTLATKLSKAADGARARIKARTTGQLKSETGALGDLSGRPPEDWIGQDFKDHALVLAADMFTRGLRTKEQIQNWLVQKYGEAIKPHMDTLVTMAQKHMVRMFKSNTTAEKKLNELLSLHESGRHGMNWYENTADWAKKNFGEDADQMLKFLAVTSANGQTEAGAKLALKAYAQWKSGMPFEGFRGPSMVGQLERISRGENLGEATKIQNFYDALKGDPNAVVLDRWMIDALGLKDKGGSLSENDYKIYSHAVKDLAEQNGMSPRQFQAAVWEGARIRKAHTTEASGGRAATSKIGSAKPLEELVHKHLGFAPTYLDWVNDNKLDLKKMENLYTGLKDVRAGKVSGHTFDPKTFEEDKTPGYIVTLANTVIDRKKFYPAELLKFKKHFEPLLNDKGHHLTLGVYDMGDGKYSVDLNVSMPDKERALAIGFKNRQREIGHFDEQGQFTGYPTGYDESKHGKQFVPPARRTAQPAWYKQQVQRIRTFFKGQGELDLSKE